jgi:multiple sugar transport system ATP-binding protein
MVFQSYALYPHMTVYKNLALGLELRSGGGGWPARLWRRLVSPTQATKFADERRRIKDRVHQTACLLGIELLLDRRPGQLSGGERQRVALGRAMVRQPAAFLLDEPLSNLDPHLRADLRRELKMLHHRLQATMLYVTHDQVEALTLGDRVAVMHQGRLQQVGPPQQVYDRPANRFVAGFVGSPPINFWEGSIANSGAGIQFICPGVAVPLTLSPPVGGDGRVVLGVRPQDVRLEASGEQRRQDDWPLVARGRVAVVEPLGDAALVSVEIDAGPAHQTAPARVTCKTAAHTPLRRADVCEVRIHPSHVHLFDIHTGESLAARSPAPVCNA